MDSFPELPPNRKRQIVLLFMLLLLLLRYNERFTYLQMKIKINRKKVSRYFKSRYFSVLAPENSLNWKNQFPCSHNSVSLDITIPSNLLISESILKFI